MLASVLISLLLLHTGLGIIVDSSDDCFPYEFPTSTSVYDDTLVQPGGVNVENGTYIRTKKEEYSCGLFDLFTCTRYRDVTCPNYKCAAGYSTAYDGGKSCPEAICDGKLNSQGACNDVAEGGDSIVTRTGTYYYGNGTCISPDVCTGCADGFFASGSTCKICPAIDKCYHRRCTSVSDNVCEWCHHELKPQRYWRAYTRDVDAGKSCQKACSWRSDSVYCYPGWCTDELANQCQCLQGFSGDNCQILEEEGTFTYNEVKLQSADLSTSIANPPNPSDVTQPRDIIWTNDLTIVYLIGKMTAIYVPPTNTSLVAPSADGSNHYVTGYGAGIIQGAMAYTITNDNSTRETSSSLCPTASRNNPVNTAWSCELTFFFQSQLRHNDIVTWEGYVTNGGYVDIMDREDNDRVLRHFINGKETAVKYSYQVDVEQPTNNGTNPLKAPDVTNSSSMLLQWSDWEDDSSGIDHYEYLVNSINNGSVTPYITTTYVNATESQVEIPGILPGLYEVIFTCFDVANNKRSTRRIALFDDVSNVDIITSNPLQIIGSSTNTTDWFVQPVTMVTISWSNHYENTRHIGSGWLEAVADYPGIDRTSKYDDNFWTRTVDAMVHINGIKEFAVAYNIESGPGVVKQSQPYTVVADLFAQQETLTGLTWSDGDQLIVTVRATDVLGMTATDSINIYRDTTPPVIEDLWMIKDNTTQLTVLSVEEFNQIEIEWTAYDLHSGLSSLRWRLIDHADVTIEHGMEYIPVPYLDNVTVCEDNSTSYSWSCHCIEFWGCQHKNFRYKPEVKLSSGLHIGMDKGIHDADYYLEITATNKANLVSTYRTKITIDITAPRAGEVSDGVENQMEVDYQQSTVLNGYWSGFFDRESSVIFYQYGFANRCLDSTDFSLNMSTTANIIQTTSTTAATETAPGNGKYYLTVLAYNQALSPSKPACSDGVTVGDSIAYIKEIGITNVHVIGGLITDVNDTDYWILDSDWTRRKIEDFTSDCVTKSTHIVDIDLIPITRDRHNNIVSVNGTIFCASSSAAPVSLLPIISVTSMIDVSWTGVDGISGVYDYEIGLATTVDSPAPDILPFQSTYHHLSYRFQHADLPTGMLFFLTFKTSTKTGLESIQSLACQVDTTPPVFTGAITTSVSGDLFVATWASTAFTDAENPTDLTFVFAIGTEPYKTDMVSWRPIQALGSCTLSTPPTCAVVRISDLDWAIHGRHSYYFTIRVTNVVGLVTMASSDAYIHDAEDPSLGVVFDIDPMNVSSKKPYKDIEDIDFQTDTSSLAARWSGFTHLDLEVTYRIKIGSTSGASDIQADTDVGSATFHKVDGLSLTKSNTYYFTVTAVTSLSQVSITSDGVTIVQENDTISGFSVFDGNNCNMTVDTSLTKFTHHDQDNRFRCEADIDYQTSTDMMHAYWTIPSSAAHIVKDMFLSVQLKDIYGTNWVTVYDYVYVYTSNNYVINNIDLIAGRKYRVMVKPCAGEICFNPVNSDGVTILPSRPVTGAINVTHQDVAVTGTANEKLQVEFDLFYDPDIKSSTNATKYLMIDHYEYAITDNSQQGNTHMTWSTFTYTTVGSSTGTFELILNGTMDFSKCRRFAIRGYSKTKSWSYVSTDIKDCDAFDPILVNPRFIVDARGSSESTDDTKGSGVYIEENAIWYAADVDYTPHKNVLSAVWHAGRYSSYSWAVLNAQTIDVTTYYQQVSQLNLTDPCSHPDVVHQKCGNTTDEFINVYFDENEYLIHGQRYVICIHAEAEVLKLELWDNVLPQLSICTDGVIVDLTSPTAGNVWIGNVEGLSFQTHTSDMYVNWDSFKDVEEFGRGRHSTGISYYSVAVGTSIRGNDVVDYTNVGVVNHAHFGGLSLTSGRQYYATVIGYDFAGRSTTKTSDVITVDSSPPSKSNDPIVVSNGGRFLVSKTEASACWTGVFTDIESDISYYKWGIGSNPGYNDVMDFTMVTTACGTTSSSSPLSLHEGHAYYINVMAVNGAGLWSMASSWAYILDISPPVKGQVYDGPRGDNVTYHVDLDYQTHKENLMVYWDGFLDPHTYIIEYYISIGVCKGCQDVLRKQPIGITDAFTLTKANLALGKVYYTTVTACNAVGMCTEATSDGILLDISLPTPGKVIDGVGTSDIAYQSSKSHIGARWYGFTDSQSGLAKFVWKAGTTVRGSNVVNDTDLGLDTYVLNTNVSLPVGVWIYITITCYDNAGLFSQSTSNGFIVDDTAPSISSGPTLSADFGVYGVFEGTYYHVDRSAMKVEWTVSDQTSYIERQYVSITSHVGGEFTSSPVKLNGIVRYYIFAGLDLHDGVEYHVMLICCNAAGLCSNSTSSAIIVDSSVPLRGMFAVDTDHAANLTRHLVTWMTWAADSLSLAWLGFSDHHSGIEYYAINIGSSFMANDLNKISDQPYLVYHNSSGVDMGDEGVIQTSLVPTQSLTGVSDVYIHMWAVNYAGLTSPVIHNQFIKAADGTLSLIRRCASHTCDGHCVCAPEDQRCPITTACTNDTDSRANSHILVSDSLTASSTDVSYTASNVVLRATWSVIMLQGQAPKWYEWSVGFEDADAPTGIIDSSENRQWFDAGQQTNAMYIIPRDNHLTDNVKYSFFVRVWYSDVIFGDFKSNGVTIETTYPTTTLMSGAAVTEVERYSRLKDMDYITSGKSLEIKWPNRFLNVDTDIAQFRIYISTFPGGHDTKVTEKTTVNSETSYILINHDLQAGVRYYSNVVAYNHIGMYTTATSDGFIVDDTPPLSGTVMDGTGLHDMDYQSDDTKVGAHWHGFVDIDSSVKFYTWCVGSTMDTTSSSMCDVINATNVGLHTRFQASLPSEAPACMYNKVFATDIAGHTSDVIVSDGICVDLSAPVPQYQLTTEDNIVENSNFSEDTNVALFNDINSTDICESWLSYKPATWVINTGSCAVVVKSGLAQAGSNFLLLFGSMYQTLYLEEGLYKLTFVTSHLHLDSAETASKEGFIQLGSRKHVFFIYTKPYRSDDISTSVSRDLITWHAHTFYFSVDDAQNHNLTIGSMTSISGFYIDDIKFVFTNTNTSQTSGSTLLPSHIVFIHEWSSIHGAWSFANTGPSYIQEYAWAIGYAPYGTQIQTYTSTGSANFGVNHDVTLSQNSTIYVTVMATNSLGKRAITVSQKILVDMTSPVITEVNDGQDIDEDVSEVSVVFVNWKASDPDSGLTYCEWAVGYSPSGIEIQQFTTYTSFSGSLTVNASQTEGHVIYNTIRCVNNAGLTSTLASDGIRISDLSPNASQAQITHMALSSTQYPALESFQGVNNSIKLYWSGFTDAIGITQHILSLNLSSSSSDVTKAMLFSEYQDVKFATFNNMAIAHGVQTIELYVKNRFNNPSDSVTRNFTVMMDQPILQVNATPNITWDAANTEFTVDWSDVFLSQFDLRFEISAGLAEGGGEILQWQETTNTYLVFRMPSHVDDFAGSVVYIHIRAIAAGGFYEDSKGTVILPT